PAAGEPLRRNIHAILQPTKITLIWTGLAKLITKTQIPLTLIWRRTQKLGGFSPPGFSLLAIPNTYRQI
ncbi:MAG: hypothetical protein QXR19_18490, partial [Candidatus Jordarchaeaceae archaeon]